MMILEDDKTIIVVLSIWTAGVISGKFFDPPNHVEMYPSSLVCVDALCRSWVDAGVQCIIATPDCRGIWFTDDSKGDSMCGFCSCTKDFTRNIINLRDSTLAVNNPISSSASKHHQPPLSPQALLSTSDFLYQH